jgi:TFIIF-interacting CTD phosphatase-like protein
MYYAKVNWFDTYKEEDSVSHMLIPAADWNDAMQKVSGQFDFINSIEMKEINFEKYDVVYLPEDVVEAVIEENTY